MARSSWYSDRRVVANRRCSALLRVSNRRRVVQYQLERKSSMASLHGIETLPWCFSIMRCTHT